MRERTYTVLLVNDRIDGDGLTREALGRGARTFAFVPVQGVETAVERMGAEAFDAVVIDLDEGGERREEILRTLLMHAGPVPTVVLTGEADSPWPQRALQLGACDCVIRERLGCDKLFDVIAVCADRRVAERALTESDERYRHLLESVTDYVYTVQVENGRPAASRHSPSCVAVTGYTSEEYARDPFLWYRMVHEEDRQAVLDMTNLVLSGQTPPPLEHRIIHKDGSIRWIRNTPVPRRDLERNLVACDGLVSDITARKQAEQELLRVNKALRESEERLKRELDNSTRAKKEWEVTFDAISNPLFIHDGEYRILRANQAYCEAAGMTFLELIGKPYYAVFPKMDGPFRNCELAMHSSGKAELLPEEEVSPARSQKIFRVQYYPVHDSVGNYLYSVHVLEDVTKMKRAEEHIRQEMEITANLLMIAEAASSTTDIDKLMEHTARCSNKVLGGDACVFYLWDKDRKTFLPGRQVGLAHEVVPLFRTEALDETVEFVRCMLDLKRPLRIRLARSGERLSAVAAALTAAGEPDDAPLPTGTPAWMNNGLNIFTVIPLFGKTDQLGLIIAGYRSDRAFTERDNKIVEGFSRQISLALDEAQLYRTAMEQSLELNNKIETLRVIHEIDRSILSSLESHDILETTTRNISRIVPCERAGILIIDRERQGFVQATGNGSPLLRPFVPFSETSATEVIKTARPQYVGNAGDGSDPLPKERQLMEEGFASHIRVPLIVKGEPVGVLGVASKRAAAFTPENLSTLEKLAALIGVALENTRLVSDMKELLLGTVKSLSNAIDAKSPWTAGHSARVTHYALEIGTRMRFPEVDLKDLELGGLLHDVGKIGIYDAILNKPASLTREEYEAVKGHPLRGVGMLEPIKQLNRIIPCVRHHHERLDGSGYPDGLKGDRIPLWARILAVADAFDSMTSDRPYRRAFGREAAIQEIQRCSATQFDPDVVNVFMSFLETGRSIEQSPSTPPHAALIQ